MAGGESTDKLTGLHIFFEFKLSLAAFFEPLTKKMSVLIQRTCNPS